MNVIYRAFCAFVGAYLARDRGVRAMIYGTREEWVIGVDDLNGERATFSRIRQEWRDVRSDEK